MNTKQHLILQSFKVSSGLPHNLCATLVARQELSLTARHSGDATVYSVKMKLHKKNNNTNSNQFQFWFKNEGVCRWIWEHFNYLYCWALLSGWAPPFHKITVLEAISCSRYQYSQTSFTVLLRYLKNEVQFNQYSEDSWLIYANNFDLKLHLHFKISYISIWLDNIIN